MSIKLAKHLTFIISSQHLHNVANISVDQQWIFFKSLSSLGSLGKCTTHTSHTQFSNGKVTTKSDRSRANKGEGEGEKKRSTKHCTSRKSLINISTHTIAERYYWTMMLQKHWTFPWREWSGNVQQKNQQKVTRNRKKRALVKQYEL